MPVTMLDTKMKKFYVSQPSINVSVALQRTLYTLIWEGVLSDRQTIEMIKNRYMKINGSLQTKIRSSSIRKVGKQVDDVYLEALIENIRGTYGTRFECISVQMVLGLPTKVRNVPMTQTM
jgi:uncharacterized protein YajQ (UPF0234 family)